MRLRNIVIPAAVITALSVAAGFSAAEPAGHDFISEARLIYRIVACGDGEAALTARFDAAAIQDHCRKIDRNIGIYRRDFIDKASLFVAKLVPGGLPAKVIVPFGGGDLLPAMVIYPNSSEYTTISLESAGDPRRLAKATLPQLRQGLDSYRSNVGYMLVSYDNSNESVRNMDRGLIPNQLSFALAALSALGYEPVSLKYFRIEQDGSLHYLSLSEIDSLENVRGQRLKWSWIDTDFSVAFRNMELAFRRKGAGPTAPVIIHRHIAFNLDNQHFQGSGLQKHLEGKGTVKAMIKGASYLIWMDNFKAIRDYLLAYSTYMISDSTGILPRHASKAGFEQITYGRFSGAFLKDNGGADAASFRNLWQSQPYRPMQFRFGYSDIYKANHLLVTRLRQTSEK